MAAKVVIPQDITNAGKDFLKEKGYEVIVGSGSTDLDILKKEVAPADAILARTAPYSAEVLAAAPNLKVIGRHGIGVDNIDVDYCTGKGIWVTYAPNSNATSVMEHTIGFMVAAAHNFVYMDKQTRTGNWEVRNQRKGTDLHGKTLGVIGLGRIGRMVAEKCRIAFGMRVLGFDAFLKPEQFPGEVEPSTVADIFARADFVTLHVPTTPETRGMVNAALLSTMKKSAFLINCARGEVVNEADLCQALKTSRIAGAAIDVFEVEPPGTDNPLFRLDNITVTPHNAALTLESMDRMSLHAAMGIDAVLAGKTPEWPVNRPKA